MAYVNARERMNAVTWQECCQLACQHSNIMGIEQAIHFKRIQNWNITFHTCEVFPHPNPLVTLGKVPEPPIFNLYLDMKELIQEFCLHNLVNMTLEKVQDFVKTIAIPECICRDGSNMSEEAFLKQCGLNNVSKKPTIHRWMKILGFSYCDHRKTYYVDGHEREDVVKYHIEFCS